MRSLKGLVVFTALFLFAATAMAGTSFNPPKYVFYFIGDGMASVQIHAAEAYLASLQEDDTVPGGLKAKNLWLSRLPAQGMASTYAWNRLITGSAAAGTALSCGKKTNIGVIAMDPDATMPYMTLAELAKAEGKKVGIVSSVNIDHATPAVFYAHQPSRNNYHEIAMELANSDFDYFGGGGFRNDEYVPGGAVETAMNNGFTFAYTREELQAISPGTRTVAINHTLAGAALYYELDRPEDHLSLAEFTRQGIRLLNNPDGFFMMVEGGKIDWACHANDAMASIMDTIAFDDAIKEAINFYRYHPYDTMIIITGDHECGGMTMGFAGTSYDTAFEVIGNQTCSYEMFDENILADYIASHDPAPADIDADMWQIILDNFGLDGMGLTGDTGDDLSDFQKERLEAGFDQTMNNPVRGLRITDPHDPLFDTGTRTRSEEDWLLYGYYEPLTVTLTHVLNQRAGIAWTSYSHTGVPVPVLYVGPNRNHFDGFYDNTDVATKIADVMGWSFPE